MSRFGDVLKNVIIGKRKKEELYKRILVVSAYGGVTNWLLEHKKTGEDGLYSIFKKQGDLTPAMDELLTKLMAINESFADIGLDVPTANDFITKRVEQTNYNLDIMSEVMASGYIEPNNILLAGREILASVGEAHSAFNSVNILNNNGIHSTLLDLSGINDQQLLTIDQRIERAIENIDLSKTLPVATGYTKGTEGIMREFDRGYSEVTFSKLAVAMGAEEAIIHKEFHLCFADPGIVGADHALPVCNTNYNVADQLADIEMEAIHPKSSKLLEQAGINLRIKNAFDPYHPGTLISSGYRSKETKVEIISGSDKVVLIDIHDTRMVGEVGFDLSIMEILREFGISYILKATDANSISFLVHQDYLSERLSRMLRKKYEMVSIRESAIVCIMGTNIAKPGVLATASGCFAKNKINVDTLSLAFGQVNAQFVITRENYQKAIKALNKELSGVTF